MSGERIPREIGRRRERRTQPTGIRQLPFARVENRYPPIALISADEIEQIHRASLRLLQEVGMEVMHEESRRILKAHGAEVDETNQRVRFDPVLIEQSIATVPPEFTLHARNPAHDVKVGGPHVIFAATGGPAFASDLDRGRRAGNSQDM
jgi:trimethylamine--corrinoid protein Co-methyltransferase